MRCSLKLTDLQAEMRALFSKPTCFIILGKPGAGKTTLARKLAIEWKCQLLNGALSSH